MKKKHLKNFDKVPEYLKEDVLYWSKITTVTINDDGMFMLDILPEPGFPNAYIHKWKKV